METLPSPSSPSVLLDSAREMSYGCISGVAGKLFEYPFDTIKVRLQSQPDGQPLRFHGPFDCFQQTWRTEGIGGFYRGLFSPLVGAAAENASLFLSYETIQAALRSLVFTDIGPTQKLPLSALLACGALSGAFTSFILTPIELIKCKMQVQNLVLYHEYDNDSSHNTSKGSLSPRSSIHSVPVQTSQYQHRSMTTSAATATNSITQKQRPPGALALIRQVYSDTGILGFWRGQLGTLFRETGGSAAWFGSYEFVSSLLRERRRKSSPSLSDSTANPPTDAIIAGACSGIAYNLSLFPADSIKSRMQTESVLSSSHTSSGRGFLQVGREMYRQGGIGILYRGCGMTVARAAPSSAIIFCVYEYLKSKF
ncbi:mitochondrial carrier domain-containing protein [Lipomyces oligophaga]|uniref:mitochondrial carrier domain-containing protein n=1 Tax=Lipomyces oligophaga TaxID=45792 RepID=UPI0034CFB9AB